MRIAFLSLFCISICFSDYCYSREDLTKQEREKVLQAVLPTNNFNKPERSESLTGGAGTISRFGPNAFSNHLTNLSFEDRQNFLIGNGLFRKLWVSSPSSTNASDGLGPLYNARACQSCHIKDGRGHLPITEKPLSLVIKTGVYEGLKLIPNKNYGKQFQFFAVPGMLSELTASVQKKDSYINLDNKYRKKLTAVNLQIAKLNYGKLDKQNSISMRISPQGIGMGLLEAIEDSDILKNEDNEDANSDGVSGKVRWVKDEKDFNRIGRFGIRASTHSLIQQTGVAFMHDMGISNPVGENAYGDCTKNQSDCFYLPTGINNGDSNETNQEVLEKIAFYLASLSPPKRRNVDDKKVLRGKEIFYKSNCISCHTPKFVTSKNAKFDFLKYQLIWPYTDLLLHDMGEELADKDLEGNVTNREWRTPPLWGVGLAKTVNDRATFLHDGRAESIEEAILWHSGEARNSLEHFLKNYKKEMANLVAFINSL